MISSQGDFLRHIPTEAVSKFPNGIDISDSGDIVVGDSHGNKFDLQKVPGSDSTETIRFKSMYVKGGAPLLATATRHAQWAGFRGQGWGGRHPADSAV